MVSQISYFPENQVENAAIHPSDVNNDRNKTMELENILPPKISLNNLPFLRKNN